MNIKKILTFVLLNLSINGLNLMASECEIPKYCEKREQVVFYDHISIKNLICSIKGSSQLRFDINNKNEIITNRKDCNKTDIDFVKIMPGLFESNVKLSRKSIDIKSLIHYISSLELVNEDYYTLEFDSFKGIDLELFQSHDSDIKRTISFDMLRTLSCNECLLRFYIGEKQMKSCQDFYDPAMNFSSPSSIFNFCFIFNEGTFDEFSMKNFHLLLTESKEKICPLVFKNVLIKKLILKGENSYFSQRLIKFSNSNDIFDDLSTTTNALGITIPNVEIDFELLHPSIFQKTKSISIHKKIKSINPDFFVKLKNIKKIELETMEFRSFIHQQGIDWIKRTNRDLNVNLSDQRQVNECHRNNCAVSILFSCIVLSSDLPMSELFPDEDFCIYRDFPFNQMVIIIPTFFDIHYFESMNPKFSCTFLWLIQYYSNYNFPTESDNYFYIQSIIDSDRFKSISKCNFNQMISMCNKSDFNIKPITSNFDIGQSIILSKSIINITSYLLCIFGFVTNLFVIITISSKKNKAEFKDFNQYKYMRINSICSCLLLSIHFLSWLTECNYPYGIFCSKVRKTYFFQYLKIIVGQVLSTTFRFMLNFLYIAFSFCRLALIGKEPNKFVKFMSEIGIKKYVSISLLISLILSAVKFFSFRINYGSILHSYPFNYDYESLIFMAYAFNTYYILNFVSDLMNYVVFILVHMSMDIGMVIKLRKTLNERLEKSKEYSTKEQQEKKENENEAVLKNAISMVILNTVVGVLLKLPTLIYSLIFMVYIIYSRNSYFIFNTTGLSIFMRNICFDSHFCEMFFTLADFLYLLYISIQFFFYKRFDKKFKVAFERKFTSKKNQK